MDLFRFLSASNQPMRNGLLLPAVKSVTWVEKFREAGELKIVSNIEEGFKTLLPTGCFVSHTGTDEVMMVEDHITNKDIEGEATVNTTGRSLEAPVLENRVVGAEGAFPKVGDDTDFNMNDNSTQTQAVGLIRAHTEASLLVDDNDEVPYLTTTTDIGTVLTSEARKIQAGNVHERVLELLAIDNLGIQTIRPSYTGTNVTFKVHRGIDRSSSVVLSMDSGDVEQYEALESLRNFKNSALVVGTHVQVVVHQGSTSGYSRRWMIIDAKDVDEKYKEPLTGTEVTAIASRLATRGRQALSKQRKISLSSADISQNGLSIRYRTDYNLGDIVTIRADGIPGTKMRVTEHAEILDENGFTSYPTLELLEGEDD
jgi:hypothetical protein